MKRLQSNFINMLLSLTIICVVAAALLSGIVLLTKKPIEESLQKKQISAISEVLPFENMQIVTEKVLVDNDSLTIHRAMVNDEEVGIAVETYSNRGFNGRIRLIVGFDKNGKILDYSILDQSETPGLGAKMVSWFKPQTENKRSLVEVLCHSEPKSVGKKNSIIGRNASESFVVSKDGGDVDAITAATISSRAFLDAVSRAAKVCNNSNKSADAIYGATTMQTKIDMNNENVEVGGEIND